MQGCSFEEAQKSSGAGTTKTSGSRGHLSLSVVANGSVGVCTLYSYRDKYARVDRTREEERGYRVDPTLVKRPHPGRFDTQCESIMHSGFVGDVGKKVQAINNDICDSGAWPHQKDS